MYCQSSIVKSIHFPEVSLLITHYNRSNSLKRLLRSFERLGCTFHEIIVSDDGSKAEHLEVLKASSDEFNYTLVTTPKNSGLGHNINKGQDAVSSKYTLYVQEDFEPTELFPRSFKQSLAMIEGDQELDIVKFYAYLEYPYLKPFKEGYSKMYVPSFATNYMKIYQYSDHPHLRRSSFLTKFGRYAEGINVERTEYKMCISFLKNKGKAVFYNDYKKLFIQKNSEAEPSTMVRKGWHLKDNMLVNILRETYRQFKYNYDILFMKPLH